MYHSTKNSESPAHLGVPRTLGARQRVMADGAPMAPLQKSLKDPRPGLRGLLTAGSFATFFADSPFSSSWNAITYIA